MLPQSGASGNRSTYYLHGSPVKRLVLIGAGEKPGRGLVLLPVVAQDAEEHGRKHDIAILLAFALLHANHHAFAVDVPDLQIDEFRHAQPGRVQGHEHGARLDPADGGEELTYLVTAEDDREPFWILGADDLFLRPVLAEGDAVKEVKGEANLVVQAPRSTALDEVQQVFANVTSIQLIGRLAKMLGDLATARM